MKKHSLRGTADTRAPARTDARDQFLIAVRVTPRAARDELILDGDILRVKLRAPPVDGAANMALVALVARRLGLPKRAVGIWRGAAAREKVLAITGLDAEGIRRRLAVAAAEE